MQANAITYSEMLAYSTLHKVKLTKFDIATIQILDRIAMTEPDKIKKGKDGS